MREIYNDENVKVLVNDEKGATTAILESCDFDAVTKIERVLGLDILDGEEFTNFNLDKALMSESISATVRCSADDVFDETEGRKLAIKKVMSKHNKQFKRAIRNWQIAMLRNIIKVCPDTFDEALHTVRPCKCNCKGEK